MARDQLLGLAADVNRLLAAGASAAAGNENLRRRGKTLQELGQKVPALKPVADAVDKVLEAPTKTAGNAFLDLLAMTRQLRSSLSGVGVEGSLTPAPTSGPWATVLHPRDSNALYTALTEVGSGREETLKDAIERQVTGDLRMLSPLLDALEDNYAAVSEMVMEDALPALGVGVVPEVEDQLKIADGKVGDTRRLDVICKLKPARGLELCRMAVKEGSVAMRVKALELLPDVAEKDETERTGLELCKDKTAEVRVAAIHALRTARSDEALDTVLEAARDRSVTARDAAAQTLASLRNPGTTPRLLAQLQDAMEKLDNLKRPTVKKEAKGKKTTAKKKLIPVKKDTSFDKKKRETISQAIYWFGILGNRKLAGRKEAAKAVLPLVEHKEAGIRQAAMSALGGIGAVIDGVIERFIVGLKDKKTSVSTGAAANLTRMEPELREPALPTVLEILEKPKLDPSLLVALLPLLPGHEEKHKDRIIPILRKVLQTKNFWHQKLAVDVLRKIGPVGAELAPEVVAALSSGSVYYHYVGEYARCLVKIDPEGTQAVPKLIELLGSKKPDARYRAIQCLQTYGPKAKAAIPKLQEMLDKGTYEYWVRPALRAIEKE